MKAITLLLLLFSISSFGQDGSDIRYYEISRVDKTIIRKYIQLDFFNRSFGGQTIDTIDIKIDNRLIKFVEVRNDNGNNNWFSEQSLQSIDEIDGLKMKISKFRLDSITPTSFKVKMYVDFYDGGNKIQLDKFREFEYWFSRKEIAEVLVKSTQP